MNTLERVARALTAAVEDERLGLVTGSDITGDVTVVDGLGLARAALEAMLEPSDDAVFSGGNTPADYAGFVVGDDVAKATFRAMIQAVLEGK